MAEYRFDDSGNVLPPEPKSVSEINEYIKFLLDEEVALQDILVVGELSNFKNHSSGHFYFSLKDEKSEIRCVMFRTSAIKVAFRPENGMKVLVRAKVSVYPAGGTYQLYVSSMQPDGYGALYLAYEQLKEKLQKEGLFDSERKKELPRFPKTIGVITSPTGAAIRDIIRVAKQRYPSVKIVLYPSAVQGEGAHNELICGIEYFNKNHACDVLIIGRGGGSIEDLWEFNNEDLARAVSQCEIPVISAVGHEIDFTICDFVADVRAATPSQGAELATPNMEEIKQTLLHFRARALQLIQNQMISLRSDLELIKNQRIFKEPTVILEPYYLKLDAKTDELGQNMRDIFTEHRQKFGEINAKLYALNPMGVLQRGYGVIKEENAIIKSIEQLKIGHTVSVTLKDGSFDSVISNIKKEN